MRRMVLVSSLLTVGLVGGGCATDSPEVNRGENARGSNAGGGGGGNSGGREEPETEIASFGDQVEFKDGLSVTVSEPRPFEASRYAAGARKFPNQLAFTVTVVNNTSKPYDPLNFTYSLQSGNGEGSEIFDTAKNLDGSPSTTVLPGRETQFDIGYSVMDPADLVMQVEPISTFNSKPAYFQTPQ